jgi:outer membrane protein assembly factor BamB
VDWTENFFESLFESKPAHLTSWVDRWATDEPEVKDDMIGTGHGRGRIAVDEDAIWVVNETSETLTRIERRTVQPDWRADLEHQPLAVATGAEAAWVLAENGWLWRFHPDGASEGVARTGHGARDLACDDRSAWVLQGDGDLIAFDQWTGEVAVEAKIPRGARRLLVADGGLIALTGGGDHVCRIEPEGGTVVARGKLPADGTVAVVHDGALWVACGRRGDKESTVVRVDPGSGEMTPWAKTPFTVHDLGLAGDWVLAACGVKLSIDVGGGGGG